MHRRNFLNSAMNGLGALTVAACGGASGAGTTVSEAVSDGAVKAPVASGGTPSVTSAPGTAAASQTPSWVPAAGSAQVVQTTNTFLSQNGNVQGWEYAFGKIVDDYSGGVYNPHWGVLGAMVFHGGGHSDAVLPLPLESDAISHFSAIKN